MIALSSPRISQSKGNATAASGLVARPDMMRETQSDVGLNRARNRTAIGHEGGIDYEKPQTRQRGE